MKVTEPCIACGTHLEVPVQYFDSLKKVRGEIEKHRPAIIKDFIENDLRPVLFELARSHSILFQAEFNRNSDINDTHFGHKAETAIIEFMRKNDLLEHFLNQ